MQDPITQSEPDVYSNSGNVHPGSQESTEQQVLEPIQRYPPTEPLKSEPPTPGIQPSQQSNLDVQQRTFLPQRGLYYATLAGVITGVLAALLTIVITLVNAGTFHAATQQIAVDRLTVKTALALAGWEILTFILSLLLGFLVGLIVGRIAVRRRLGFLAGALAGAVFYLVIFFVSLIPSYPGNLTGKGTTITGASLIISLLLLCLWSISGGLISLFGTWVTTVRHPHYLRSVE